LQRLAVVAFAFADLTGDIDVRQKVHLDLQNTVALARFAAAALDVKRESSAVIAAGLCFGGLCKELADVGKYAGVGGWIGARSASNRALADFDNLVQCVQSDNFFVFSRAALCLIELGSQSLI